MVQGCILKSVECTFVRFYGFFSKKGKIGFRCRTFHVSTVILLNSLPSHSKFVHC